MFIITRLFDPFARAVTAGGRRTWQICTQTHPEHRALVVSAVQATVPVLVELAVTAALA